MPAFKKYPALLLLSIVLFSDCRKKPFNYRNKYAGTWNFTFTTVTCELGQPCVTRTEDHTGKVTVGANKEEIDLDYGGANPRFTVDKQGNLGGCGVTGAFEGSTKVAFIRDFGSECTGALGSASGYTVTGTKN